MWLTYVSDSGDDGEKNDAGDSDSKLMNVLM